MDKYSKDFISALERGDLQTIKTVPKSDLHNHSALGSPFEKLQQWYGKPLTPPPFRLNGIRDFDAYLFRELRHAILTPDGYKYAFEASFRHALEDGVKVLEMSIDIWFLGLFNGDAGRWIRFLDTVAEPYKDKIFFIPQLGFPRELNLKDNLDNIIIAIKTGFFRSIDLYGDEQAAEPETFREIFSIARKSGLRLKAHASEFGNASSIRYAVEVLGLDEVQHGISAAQSEEVMDWLKERGTQLNICPSSNVALGCVGDIKRHPIRTLFDHGIKVTVNSDDLMIFGQSVSDEYLNLFKAEVLTARELDTVRCRGLAEAEYYSSNRAKSD